MSRSVFSKYECIYKEGERSGVLCTVSYTHECTDKEGQRSGCKVKLTGTILWFAVFIFYALVGIHRAKTVEGLKIFLN